MRNSCGGGTGGIQNGLNIAYEDYFCNHGNLMDLKLLQLYWICFLQIPLNLDARCIASFTPLHCHFIFLQSLFICSGLTLDLPFDENMKEIWGEKHEPNPLFCPSDFSRVTTAKENKSSLTLKPVLSR